MQKTVLKMTYAGVFIALSIVLTRVFTVPIQIAGIQAIRINLGFIPIILAGIILGPKYGGAVGGIADILGYLLNSGGGAYFPGFTLTSAMVGILPALMMLKFKLNIFILFVSIFITTLTVTVLNTFWLVILFNKGFMILLVPRLLSLLIMCPVYTFFVYYLKKILDKTLRYKAVFNNFK